MFPLAPIKQLCSIYINKSHALVETIDKPRQVKAEQHSVYILSDIMW